MWGDVAHWLLFYEKNIARIYFLDYTDLLYRLLYS